MTCFWTRLVGTQQFCPGPAGTTFLLAGVDASLNPLLQTSTDGVTWVTRTTGFPAAVPAYIGSLAAGDGLFLAAGADDTAALMLQTSPTGEAWTTRTAPDPGVWFAWGGGAWLAGGYKLGSEPLSSSSDLASWTSRPSHLGVSGVADSVYFVDGLFFSGGSASGGAMVLQTSADLASWTNVTPAGVTNGTIASVLKAGGVYVAGGSEGLESLAGYLATSTDTTSWTARTTAFTNTGDSVNYLAYDEVGTIVAFGLGSGGTVPLLQTSANSGVSWTTRATGLTGSLAGACYGNGKFLIAADGAVMTSTDGASWTTQAGHGFAGGFIYAAIFG